MALMQVFTGESFGYTAASLCSFHADWSGIGCQDCSREPFCLSVKERVVMYQTIKKWESILLIFVRLLKRYAWLGLVDY